VRAVIQRVARAKVTVADEVVGAIGPGLLVLLGVARHDGPDDARIVADKIASLRIFPDAAGRMNRSVVDVGGAVLLVSQFTLLAEVDRGRRPSFSGAAPPDVARPLVAAVGARLAAAGVPVAEGRFGARMSVELVNEGPVTIVLDVVAGRVC